MHVHIIDTSILCNILNIPHRNQHHIEVMKELKRLQEDKSQLILLPFASIIETGNHIAHISDGSARRTRAELMSLLIKKTVKDEAPWTYYGKEFERDQLLEIADGLVEYAVSEIGLGDLSIVQVFKKFRDDVPAVGSVRIWSLDHHLSSYKEEFQSPRKRK